MAELRDVSDPAGALATDAVKALAALMEQHPGWTHQLDGGRHVIRDELGILVASNDDLAAAVATANHPAAPLPGTARRTKPGFGAAPAALDDARHYPAEAICACGLIVRCEAINAKWTHTRRMPGDPPLTDNRRQ